ncbi:MAG: biotin-dependent carboxyltransferase family protein [Caldimonas sp.]
MTDISIEVVAVGAFASVQDCGRRGYRRIGVPWSGVLDPQLMRIANALAGNVEGAPVIECFDGGLRLAARGAAVRIAVTGDAVIEHESAGERRVLASWRSMSLADGDMLRIRRMTSGRIAVVAVEGLELPLVLGSASTYARAALGGLDGRPLRAGQRLPVPPASVRPELLLAEPPKPTGDPVRVVAGPQADHFTDAVRAAFVDADYLVSAEADRMGVRLQGPALAHVGAPEIVSDATVPGSIQVPGSGQPIVLLADAQTAGGYPKIGTVVSADLPRLAAARPGQRIRFAWVDATVGEALARSADSHTRTLLKSLRPLLSAGIDESALYAGNLVTGFIDAMAPEFAHDDTAVAAPFLPALPRPYDEDQPQR